LVIGFEARSAIVKWINRSSARRRWGGPGVFAGLALIAVFSAACSSPPPSRSIASLPSRGGSTTTPPTLSKAQQIALDDQHMVDFARCMRSHGVNQYDPVPDTTPGHAGLTMQLPSRTASNGAAFDACIHFMKISDGGNGSGGSAMSAAQLAARTNYARCMRSHDIAMLDPDPYGDLGLGKVPGINNGFGRYSPQFRAADSACRHLLPAGTNDNRIGHRYGNGP
jgi:hypothetical protein